MTDTCHKCQMPMQPGIAIGQTVSGVPDFASDTTATTLSAGGPGRVIDCLKCPKCGRSVTKGGDDE